MNQALDNFLGLVRPSGKLTFGFDSLKKIKAERVKLIVVISSASEKTKLAIDEYASFNHIEVIAIAPTSVPRLLDGKNLAVFSVLDANMASKIKKLVKEGDTYE